MLSKKAQNIKHTDIIIGILVFLLFLGLLSFVVDSLQIVSQTNKDNFTYTVKTRDALEKADRILERAEVNTNMLAAAINASYDTSKLYNKEYNIKYTDGINLLIKSLLINSPQNNGVWFQINADLPFANSVYCWYEFLNGKVVDVNKKLTKVNLNERAINPKDDPYYFQAIKAKKTIWSDIYTDSETKTSMLTIAEPIYKNGVLIGVVGVDISVANLKETLKNMQSVFEHSEVFLLDTDKQIVIAQLENNHKMPKRNNAFIKLFNKKAQDELAMTEFFDGPIKKTAIMLAVSKEYNIVITFPNKLIDKGFNGLFNTIYFVFTILCVLIVLSFINRTKMTEINKQLKDETQKLRTILDNSPNIVVIKSLDGIYIDCNKKFLELLGMEKKDVIGKSDYELFNEDETADIKANETIAKETRETFVKESYYFNKKGTKIDIEKYIIPFFNFNNEMLGIIIIGIDVTRRNQEKAVLRGAKEAAEKATLIKSNFLANMSHEIRTPMNGVLGFIQLLQETNLSEDQSEFVSNAQMASETLLNIINDILDFSKIEADKLEIDKISFDVRSVVEDVILMTKSNADKKGIDVSSLICSDVPQKVLGDPGRVKQILNNLVGNAIKFTQQGEVVMHVGQAWEDSYNSVLSFKVKDTGIGIDKENLDLIFDAFIQSEASTTRRFGGTGLGLAISKKLADLMDGTLYVESTINEGSEFTLTVPFFKDESFTSEINGPTKSLDGAKILVIDSNNVGLEIFQAYLSEANCIIYKAKSIEEGLEIINTENISVILIDYKIENIDDKDLHFLINENEKTKNLPIILSVSSPKRGDSIIAKEKGFAGYVSKSIERNEFIETIAMVIDNKNGTDKKEFFTKHIVKEYKFNEKAKVLVVEDSEINCKLILKILGNNGLTCDLATNGQKAIEAFKSNKYDLILMDCQMPILDGYEATKEIREIENGESHTPIIAMTANALARDEEKCYEFGMDEYISKPINIGKLMGIISKYIKADENSQENLPSHEIEMKKATNKIEKIINTMMEELGFEKDEATELIKLFVNTLPEIILELETTLNGEDFETLKKLAHKLKGSGSNLRVEKIARLSLQLEGGCLKKDKEFCADIICQIKKYVEGLNKFSVELKPV